jgi:hypothetical protein
VAGGAARAALLLWHFFSLFPIVSHPGIRNSLSFFALRGDASSIVSLERPLLYCDAARKKPETNIRNKRALRSSGSERRDATMYQLSVYPITPDLWRWEIRCGGALLRCGTAPTRVAAETDVNDAVNT